VQHQAQNEAGRVLWSEIATLLPGTSGKQCSERYFNHLDPSINKGDWNATEDRILYEGQRQFGNRWCDISKVLPGHTENSVKNRWNSNQMRKWLKDNDLRAGSGVPLYGIVTVKDLQRALSDFARSLAEYSITISKESEATLLLGMTNPVPKANEKKEKVKRNELKL
jgi:hypothetical protein